VVIALILAGVVLLALLSIKLHLIAGGDLTNPNLISSSQSLTPCQLAAHTPLHNAQISALHRDTAALSDDLEPVLEAAAEQQPYTQQSWPLWWHAPIYDRASFGLEAASFLLGLLRWVQCSQCFASVHYWRLCDSCAHHEAYRAIDSSHACMHFRVSLDSIDAQNGRNAC
jgi:hypothetical protein